MGKAHGAVARQPFACAVGTAMGYGVANPAQGAFVYTSVRRVAEEAGYAAHKRRSTSRLTRVVSSWSCSGIGHEAPSRRQAPRARSSSSCPLSCTSERQPLLWAPETVRDL